MQWLIYGFIIDVFMSSAPLRMTSHVFNTVGQRDSFKNVFF